MPVFMFWHVANNGKSFALRSKFWKIWEDILIWNHLQVEKSENKEVLHWRSFCLLAIEK